MDIYIPNIAFYSFPQAYLDHFLLLCTPQFGLSPIEIAILLYCNKRKFNSNYRYKYDSIFINDTKMFI